MKFSGSISINQPRDLVTRYFSDPNFLGEYQDGFIKKELIEGEAGKDGAVSKMFYKYGKRDMELTERILKNQLPAYFEAEYHHKHMDNSMKCTFIAVDNHNTLYTYEFEYTRISGFIPKLMALLFPGIFKRQGEKWLKQFKEFVENQ